MASLLQWAVTMTMAARWQHFPQDGSLPGDPPPQEARFSRWDLLLASVAVYVAAAVGRIHEVFTFLMPLKLALVATVLALGLYLLQQSSVRRMVRLRSDTTTCLLGLALWGLLSIPGALAQGIAFRAWTDLARSIGMCLVVAASVRNARDVERLMFVYFGVTAVYTGVVLSRFQLGAESWRLGRLYYYDANDLATLIATAMPLGLYFVLGRGRAVVRAFAGIGLAVLAVGLIRSGSRGGFLAFLAVAAFVLLRVTTIPARSRLAGLVVILAVLSATASDQYWAQMQTIVHPKEDYNTTSEEGRLKVWARGLDYMAGSPVFGVGVKNFPVAEGTISPLARLAERGIGVRWGAAHNSYVQVGAELGIPGLLLFIGLIWSAFKALGRAARPGGEAARLAQSLMAALVGFVVGAFFLSLAYTDMLFTLMALVLATAKTSHGDVALRRSLGRAPGWGGGPA